jgi:hypothetical protein
MNLVNDKVYSKINFLSLMLSKNLFANYKNHNGITASFIDARVDNWLILVYYDRSHKMTTVIIKGGVMNLCFVSKERNN